MKVLKFFTIIFMLFGLHAEEYKFEMKGVKASLVSEYSSIAPGQKFTVAVFLQHFDDFHTYWRNPGMVGYATQIKWILPEGFKAGEVKWQVPERAKMLKFNCHAYSGDTYLLAEIQAPGKLPEKFDLKAKIGGMSCSTKECCKIGFMNLSVSLRGADKSVKDVGGAIIVSTAKKKLPEKLKSVAVKGELKDGFLYLNFSSSKKIKNAEDIYFYANENITDTEKQQELTVNGNGSLQLKIKLSSYVPENLKTIEGLLYRKSGWNEDGAQYSKVSLNLN